MRSQKSKQTQGVYRITVDEKLGPDLIRLLIASLKKNKKTFSDNPKHWNEEEAILVSADTYKNTMRLTRNNAKKLSWGMLREGQVFLVGKFKTLHDPNIQTKFALNPKRKNFRRIDPQIKNDIKRKYLRALQGGIQDG